MITWMLASALAAPPAGWTFDTQPRYAIEVVQGGPDGNRCAHITGRPDAPGFAPMHQSVDAGPWRGLRVQLTAQLKVADVRDWAGAWMRIDGSDGSNLGFDNMQNRALRGTMDWATYTVVLDVPEEATKIVFGSLLVGSGEMWVDGVRLEKVSTDTPVTNLHSPNRTPKNLTFER